MSAQNSSSAAEFAQAVVAGLSAEPKNISPKYLYDERGSELFDRICGCPEYYVTRTELVILEARASEIAAQLGERPLIFEPGSGVGRKTRILLDALPDAAAYIPIEISRELLHKSASLLRREYPRLPVIPVWGDFTQPWEVPAEEIPEDAGRRVVFFPGSTIGNFEPAQAEAFLARTSQFLGSGGWLLVGFDLLKAREVLEAAYDDSSGATAAFNINLLHRMRRELDAEVDIEGFRHLAVFNESESRVEMHLVSLREQEIRVLGQAFRFARGETLHTECSYKYSSERFEKMAQRSGFAMRALWTDSKGLFAVGLFEAR